MISLSNSFSFDFIRGHILVYSRYRSNVEMPNEPEIA